MKYKKFGATEQRVYDLIKPITDELGYYLWDVSYVKEGAMWYLRIFIDQDEGITIEDCEKVTEPVNQILDEKDPIPQQYMLEVGSAGLEREPPGQLTGRLKLQCPVRFSEESDHIRMVIPASSHHHQKDKCESDQKDIRSKTSHIAGGRNYLYFICDS